MYFKLFGITKTEKRKTGDFTLLWWCEINEAGLYKLDFFFFLGGGGGGGVKPEWDDILIVQLQLTNKIIIEILWKIW